MVIYRTKNFTKVEHMSDKQLENASKYKGDHWKKKTAKLSGIWAGTLGGLSLPFTGFSAKRSGKVALVGAGLGAGIGIGGHLHNKKVARDAKAELDRRKSNKNK